MKLAASALLLLSAAAFAAPEDWRTIPQGEVAMFAMAYAPFPHATRAEGHTYQGKQFPRDPHYVDSTTALFIPSGYRQDDTVDLLYYFHGWSNTVEGAMKGAKLPEQVLASGKNVILVFPEGPRNAQDSAGGKLEDAGGMARLTDEVMTTLRREGKIRTDAKLGKVIISGHSGAYRILGATANRGGIDKNLSEIYLLDSSYGYLDEFVRWMEDHPDKRLVSIYTDHLADENESLIKGLGVWAVPYVKASNEEASDETLTASPRVFLHTTKLNHNETVTRLESFLKTSGLEDREE